MRLLIVVVLVVRVFLFPTNSKGFAEASSQLQLMATKRSKEGVAIWRGKKEKSGKGEKEIRSRRDYSVKVRTDVITIITIIGDTSSSSSSSFSRWLTDRRTEEGGTKQ